MKITSIKTHKITNKDTDLLSILDKYVIQLEDESILAITSKIVSITEGSIAMISDTDKDSLIEQEAQFFLPREDSKYHVSLTITRNTLVATAGIDESNGNGYYVLWPKDPQKTANMVRLYLRERFRLKNIGVIITDSKTTPLRWGVTAISIAYSGLLPLKDYIGKPDIFGRKFEFEKMSIIDNLASAAALVMGEGSEQTPMAKITDLQNVEFVDKNPAVEELRLLHINIDDDLFAPLIKNAKWKRSRKG